MRIVATLLALVVVNLFTCSTVVAQEKPALKVGVILSLSGGLEQWCDYMRQGMELAASEESSLNLQVIFEDDRSVDKKASVSAAKKLVHVDKSHVILSWTLSEVAAISPITSKNHIPLVIGAYDNRIARIENYVFGGIVNYQIPPRTIANFFKSKGAHRVALVTATDDWSSSFEGPFREEAARLGLEISYSENILPAETETRSIVTNLKRHNVEAVLAPLYGNSLVSFIRRHREMNAQSIISVGDGMFESDIQAIGESSEGVTATQIWLESPELKKKVAARFAADSNPLQLGLVASGYDLMQHVILASKDLLKRGLAISGENLNDAFKSFRSVGYLGEHMLGAAPTNAGEKIVVVKKGRYELAQ